METLYFEVLDNFKTNWFAEKIIKTHRTLRIVKKTELPKNGLI
jgi:hypothetical protein